MNVRHLFYGFLLILTTPAWSQKLVKQGHKQFQELAYSDAIISLEKAIEKGYKSPIIYTELADSYYFNGNYQSAEKFYQLLFLKPKNILAVHYFRYAQSLKSVGKKEQADLILNQIPRNTIKQKTLDYSSVNKDFNQEKSKNSGRFKIQLTSFNSKNSDFGPSYYGNQIVFASAKDTGSIFKRNHTWTNQPFTDLYQVNPDSATSKPMRFSKSINSKFNESSAVFTKDGSTMYFTRNNFENNKRGINQKQTTLLKIYKAIKNGVDWKVVGALPFCNPNYNVAHPALSPDEKTLYFASDMPGGFGESDLYKVPLLLDGSFGKLENLGSSINTFARETFPFISQNNELFFSSDGHGGFGGLDVFISNFDENFIILQPQNVGEPVNSRMDDFGFIINSVTKKGYFTSNRSNGLGMDDIYSFEELIPLPCKTILQGRVVVKVNTTLVTEVELVLLNANSIPVASTKPDVKGNYSFSIDCKENYTIQTDIKGYVSQIIEVNPKLYATTTLDEIRIEKQQVQFQLGDDLAKKLGLFPIYFDLGKFNIRADAAAELAKIKTVLLEYPTMTIDIRSHTDSRDTSENNQNLSAKRADATVKWFTANGIDSQRISGKGYGESQLLNICNDGVPCTELQHQINRRSEFIITGI